MSSVNTVFSATLLSLAVFSSPVLSADLSCGNLVPSGVKLACPGFEPNWSVELICDGTELTSNFVDAFSGDGIVTTPGTATFLSEKPWGFATSHGIEGLITYTPGACQDESDRFFDFTLTTETLPGFDGQIAPICCRME